MSVRNIDAQDVVQAGIFLDRDLEQSLAGVLKKREVSLWSLDQSIIPLTYDLDPGVEKLTEELQTDAGQANFLADRTSDISFVDYSVREETYKAVDIGTAFTYTVMQLDNARRAGKSITQRKLEVANRSINEKLHQFLLYGEQKYNSFGLYNNPLVPVSNSGFDPNSNNIQDHINFIVGEIDRVVVNNKLTSGVERILIPHKLWTKWAGLINTGNGQSMINVLRDVLGGLGVYRQPIRLEVVREADANIVDANVAPRVATAGFDRLIFMPYTSGVMAKAYTVRQMPVQQQAFSFYTYVYAGVSEVMIQYPLEMLYSDITPVL